MQGGRWRVLEEREWDTNGEGAEDDKWEPRRQYVYGSICIDEVLILDKDTDDGDCTDGGGSSRHFYTQQANWNVVAVTDSFGDAAEKVAYDPYGEATVTVQGGHSSTGSPYLFQGRSWDEEVDLYYFRNRLLNPSLGRWLTRDPAQGGANVSLYSYARGQPNSSTDPAGLWAIRRTRLSRATVIAETNCETYEELARQVRMNPRTVRLWLRPYKGEEEVRKGDTFTVPNTVVVALGQMWSPTHLTVVQTATASQRILSGKGFSVQYFDYMVRQFTAKEVRQHTPNLYGLVMFGHGGLGGKWRGPLTGHFYIRRSKPREILHPVNISRESLGLLVAKICYARQGGWGAAVSPNGVSWVGSGLELSGWTVGILRTVKEAR